MSVGTKYTALSKVQRDAVYTCAGCLYTAPVTVIGVASASANASHLLGNHDAAQDTARKNADRAAELDVERMMGLVRCPACGERNKRWVRRFFIENGIKLGFFAMCSSLFVLFVFHRMEPLTLLGVWAGAMALTTGLYFFAVSPQMDWQRAALCVRFPKPESP